VGKLFCHTGIQRPIHLGEENYPTGCSKSLSSKAAGESKPEAYPLGDVEGFDEPRTPLAGFFSILLMGDLLAAQVYLPYTIVCLYLFDVAFADDGPLVQDGHDSGNLPDKIHIVLDDDDRMFLRQ
jgi:hypothetical protein